MRVLSMIALVVSVFLLLSTTTTLMREQVPIIGMLKAIGARRGQVLGNYLVGAVIYGVARTAIGLILGMIGGQLVLGFFADVETLDVGEPSISPAIVLISVLVGVGVPLLGATRLARHSGHGPASAQRLRAGRWCRHRGPRLGPPGRPCVRVSPSDGPTRSPQPLSQT